jgi:hypothetical protein
MPDNSNRDPVFVAGRLDPIMDKMKSDMAAMEDIVDKV